MYLKTGIFLLALVAIGMTAIGCGRDDVIKNDGKYEVVIYNPSGRTLYLEDGEVLRSADGTTAYLVGDCKVYSSSEGTNALVEVFNGVLHGGDILAIPRLNRQETYNSSWSYHHYHAENQRGAYAKSEIDFSLHTTFHPNLMYDSKVRMEGLSF